MHNVVIPPHVSQKIGALLQSREAVISVLLTLRDDLENHYIQFRGNRNPDDPDYFFYSVGYFRGWKWNNLDFSVNDTRADGFLFVDEVS